MDLLCVLCGEDQVTTTRLDPWVRAELPEPPHPKFPNELRPPLWRCAALVCMAGFYGLFAALSFRHLF